MPNRKRGIIFMNMSGIIKDAVKYPSSDWKKILIFGIIILITTIPATINRHSLISTNDVTLIWFLGIISFLSFFFIRGYSIRIIKSSLTDSPELPKFNNWIGMFIDGIKLFIIPIVYLVPAILIILIYSALYSLSNPSTVINILSGVGIYYFIGGTGLTALFSWLGIWSYIIIIYAIIILPIILMAITHMVNNNSKLLTAFQFKDIIDKISLLGWRNLIIGYILTVIVSLSLIAIFLFFIAFLFLLMQGFGIALTQTLIVEDVLIPLFLLPYLLMYFFKSVALFYKS